MGCALFLFRIAFACGILLAASFMYGEFEYGPNLEPAWLVTAQHYVGGSAFFILVASLIVFVLAGGDFSDPGPSDGDGNSPSK